MVIKMYKTIDGKKDIHVRNASKLLEQGFIALDEDGGAILTVKGKKRVEYRLNNLQSGDEILLNVAFCESHSIRADLI